MLEKFNVCARVDVSWCDVTAVDVPSILVRDISSAASHDVLAPTRQKPEIFDDIQRSTSQTSTSCLLVL